MQKETKLKIGNVFLQQIIQVEQREYERCQRTRLTVTRSNSISTVPIPVLPFMFILSSLNASFLPYINACNRTSALSHHPLPMNDWIISISTREEWLVSFGEGYDLLSRDR
jgi:hypothetical protein